MGPNTTVYFEGTLQPGLRDLLPPEVLQEITHLPQGLQMLLLSTMENSDAAARLAEARSLQETLRRGDGMSQQQISYGMDAPFRWPPPKHLESGAGSGTTAPEVCTSCMVCLCDFEDGEECRRLPCNHTFHKSCVEEWLSRSPVCPICKGPSTRPGGPQQRPGGRCL